MSTLSEEAVERPRLRVEVCQESGYPRVTLPTAWLWDFVEYLSYDRVAVRYLHEGEVFVVRFERSNAFTAQRIMDDWAHSKPETSRNQ